MATLIMTRMKDKLDPSMKQKAFTFLEKLARDDTLPGLHIEPIVGSVDARVRTGRVDDNFRAVLFKLTATAGTSYVVHGFWPHDRANSIAERVTLTINPVNGVPEIKEVVDAALARVMVDAPRPTPPVTGPAAYPVAAAPVVPEPRQPLPAQTLPAQTLPAQTLPATPAPGPVRLWAPEVNADTLTDQLGIDPDLAHRALTATEDELLTLVESAPDWQGLALLELATGAALRDVQRDFALDRRGPTGGSEDDRIVAGLQTPAAKATFAFVEDDQSLREAIDSGDFAQWRLFLHPTQRLYAENSTNGPFRLTGGAGTGKTVVTVHRARNLSRSHPQAKVLLTTFTRNLATAIGADLHRLDPKLTLVDEPGRAGVLVRGIDSLVFSIVQGADDDQLRDAVATVLGTPYSLSSKLTASLGWRNAIASVPDLPPNLRSPAFFRAEYSLIVLKERITTLAGYLRVRRTGRGVALDRSKRMLVWQVIEAYRTDARLDESTDYIERAEIAAAYLQQRATDGWPATFDHVLVDEAQDLSPSHLKVLRALVGEHANDLFISEDSHQRIYGHKLALKPLGINIVGRSRPLRLNYRTTAQNLAFAMRILSGEDFTNLEGEQDEVAYTSSRSGPAPRLLPVRGAGDELDQSARLLTEWLTDDPAPAPETVAVLVRDKLRRDTVVAGLGERGVQVRAVDREAAPTGHPVVMTMHRAKGMEFTHVLLFDVGAASVPRILKEYDTSDEDRREALARERSLVYVAATRARDVLAVSWTGTVSPLLGGPDPAAPT